MLANVVNPHLLIALSSLYSIVYHKYREKDKTVRYWRYCNLSRVSKYITSTTSSLLMVPTAVGVLIATIILSAIPMLAFAQGGGDREMAMNNRDEEGGAEAAALFLISQKI